MSIVLGANQYGKAECRLVRIDRDTPRHRITDVSVTSQLRGDLEAAHTVGDNSHVVATDTQKNTVYAFARDGLGAIEDFALRLGRHFTDSFDWIDGGRWEIEQYSWARIPSGTDGYDHSFVKSSDEKRNTVVTIDETGPTVISGVSDLVVLNSTASEFWGYPKDRYTTLKETTDRILATSVSARWRYLSTDLDFDKVFDDVRSIMLDAFASTHSLALQQSLFQMGTQVLEAHPEIGEIKFSMPNIHHFLVDLEPFGLDNPGEVFYVADRPYGLIEATVKRDDVPDAGHVWATVPGFC
ncbi:MULTISPECIES: factor-independent urate hydroxylase [Nocardiaceae]|jgi:urate oxidase|uniref:factor-independent urate hydroxylase n=1 Tax=Nocardiaceae TaxID=85025 RepID=UPI000364BA19|nr:MULTISPECIES: urate oxidase [Rhodococcus]OZE96149.1 urate oxidase [Rhodococcus sp. 15-1189-1-1a]OZF10695.1 urate oxidase [Rhodococcus sp. 14-2686-1-2]